MTDRNEQEKSAEASGSRQQPVVIGPPAPGPIVNVQAPGIYLHMQVNDDLDFQILQLVLARAEQRRYARLAQ